ncbi:FG-GAP-like repeat-containing protein, partial [Bacteroidota bacterium]
FVQDVMNRVKVINKKSNNTPEVLLLDTFPNFNGFPKHISGNSFEGGLLVNMDSDPDFEVVYNISYTVNVWNLDGSSVTGWPQNLTQPAQGAPAYGDIDGDGEDEVVVTTIVGTSSGNIYAFEKDGSSVTGFPISHGYSTRTPVLADLDGNGSLEIIVNKRLYPLGEGWVYKGDGTVYPGWPQPLVHVPASSAAVGDITGDAIPEIVMEAYTAIYAWDKDGNLLPGFPFNLPANDVTSYSSPVLADVDGDNVREIIFGTHETAGNLFGHVFIIKNDGTVLPNWPKSTSQWVYAPPAVGYIDDDNILDIAVGDQVLSTVPSDFLYAWNINGDLLSGFPVGPRNAVNNQVVLADIDNDNMQELIVDDNGAPLYHGYNHDGSIMNGWPISLNGDNTFFEMPALGDIDGNGTLDMLCAANEGFGSSAYVNVNLLNTGFTFVPGTITLACFQYNERHNGVYGDVASTIPVELTSFTASVDNNVVQLNWSTASETNNQGFEVQRKNSAGDFSSIGFISGKGTTSEEQSYQYTDTNLEDGKYFYRLKQVDYNGSFEYSEIVEADVNLSPRKFSLNQNYPNPFNPGTRIVFTIPAGNLQNKSSVLATLKVFDVLGNEVATLLNEEMEAGSHEIIFDATGLTSGIYFYQLRSGDFISTKKMTLLR